VLHSLPVEDNLKLRRVLNTGLESTGAVSGDRQYGLVGMRERAKLCNGQLMIDSGSGKGTTVRLTVEV